MWFLLRKVPSAACHSERSEEAGLFEILRFAQDERNDFPQQKLITYPVLGILNCILNHLDWYDQTNSTLYSVLSETIHAPSHPLESLPFQWYSWNGRRKIQNKGNRHDSRKDPRTSSPAAVSTLSGVSFRRLGSRRSPSGNGVAYPAGSHYCRTAGHQTFPRTDGHLRSSACHPHRAAQRPEEKIKLQNPSMIRGVYSSPIKIKP
jgi:hypothetical protein